MKFYDAFNKKKPVCEVDDSRFGESAVLNDSFLTNGLNAEEVSLRISAGKLNGDQNVKTKSVVQILFENVVTFFNFLFVVLAVILAFFVKPNIAGLANFGFLILVVFNALIGIFQELRAKRTIDKLSLISAPKAVVIRSGEEKTVAVKDILLDDLTVLSAGCQICSDARITEGSIEVNESLITGEPDAILKQAGDEVMSGSFVVSGRAKAKVLHIGIENFAAKISAGAKYFKKPNSEIWRSLMIFVKIMALIIVPIGVSLFCIQYLVRGHELNETVLYTVGTLVGMVPSGLVALSSTVFCVSVIRLTKHKTLAQDLYCIETLARVDVLCLDKTGTITEGTMEVNGIETADGENEEKIKGLLKNFTAALSDDNATSNAVKRYVENCGVTAEAEQTVPFSSARKWSGARFENKSYVLGAPEFVFKNPEKSVTDTTAEMAEKGFRVLVLASAADSFVNNELPEGLKLEAFVFITDKIREEAPDTLRFFKEQGVTVKIISGDNPATVRAVALRAGLTDCDQIVDMSTLKTEQEVYDAAEKYSIFGRVLPDQKLMLVKALKEKGHTVAMTGDGVNDVLALKEADCSVAMASGSDAAKNVSSLVLLDSNFASMPKVVAEGRRSINNLERSAALYLMKTFYNTFLAVLFMCVSVEMPFEPRHLTLIGAVTIGMPSVVLALEPNKERVTGRFLPKVIANALPGGITVLLGVAAVVICSSFFLTQIDEGQVRSMYLIVTTTIAFIFLIKVSIPFTWIHFATIIAMMAIFIGCYFVPWQLVHDFFGIQQNVTWPMGQAMMSIIAVVLPIFVVLTLLMKKFNKKLTSLIDNDAADKLNRIFHTK